MFRIILNVLNVVTIFGMGLLGLCKPDQPGRGGALYQQETAIVT